MKYDMLTEDTLAAAGVEISHHFVHDEVYLKRSEIAAGACLGKHVHPFDHASFLAKGTVRLTVDGEAREVRAPAALLVQKNRVHTVTALTDVVWYCAHITSDTDPASVDATILKG